MQGRLYPAISESQNINNDPSFETAENGDTPERSIQNYIWPDINAPPRASNLTCMPITYYRYLRENIRYFVVLSLILHLSDRVQGAFERWGLLETVCHLHTRQIETHVLGYQYDGLYIEIGDLNTHAEQTITIV